MSNLHHLLLLLLGLSFSLALVSGKREKNKSLPSCDDGVGCTDATAICTTTPIGDRCKKMNKKSCEDDEDCDDEETCFLSATAAAGYCDGCSNDTDCPDEDVCAKKTRKNKDITSVNGKCRQRCTTDDDCTDDREVCNTDGGFCRRQRHRRGCNKGRRRAARRGARRGARRRGARRNRANN